jgi:hypothetical protein
VSGAASPNTMTEWRRRALSWSRLDTLRFPTGILCTAIELETLEVVAGSPADATPRGRTPCQPRSRSPPGDSN